MESYPTFQENSLDIWRLAYYIIHYILNDFIALFLLILLNLLDLCNKTKLSQYADLGLKTENKLINNELFDIK